MPDNDPFAPHPDVPKLTVTSTTVSEGGQLSGEQMSGLFGVPGGKDVSPQLSWSAGPEGTKSYAVTVHDPDAPTGCGFCHWVITNIPASVTELAEDAGNADDGSGLPEGAMQHRQDAGGTRYIGAAPPAGHGPHRYFYSVYAVDVEDLGLPVDASPALVGFTLFSHTLARGDLVVTAEIKG